MKSKSDPHFLDALRGLTWPARQIVRFGTPGIHRSRIRGPAPEFSEYRAFRQGDDPRRLDWKLLARTDRAYLRLTEDRAAIGTLLVLDASPSMNFPEREPTKWNTAARLAVGLAQVARQSGDAVGLLVSGTGWSLPLRARSGVVARIASLLAGVKPGSGSGMVRELGRRAWAARVVILSDFLDEEDALLAVVATHVARGGEVHAVRVVAREELEPPPHPFTATDPENPAVTRPFDPATRELYRTSFLAWSEGLAARWRAVGAAVRWNDVRTDEPAVGAIRRVIGKGP